MATGRIQPGSRQWVEAMRRLSATTDPTVDMSMGRKVSRDAAIPHGMGTAALDTRLRGGSEPGELAFEVVSTQMTGATVFRVSGGRAPYTFDPRDGTATRVIPAAGEFSHAYPGPLIWDGSREASITSADGQALTIRVDFFAPIPSVWTPVSVAALEQGSVVSGPFTLDIFDFFNFSSPGTPLLRGRSSNAGQIWVANETGLVTTHADPTPAVRVALGQTQKVILYSTSQAASYGFEIAAPNMLPSEMQPQSVLEMSGSTDRVLRARAANGGWGNNPNLTVLNTVYGSLGQTDRWPEGHGLQTSGDPFGSPSGRAHWNGTAWADGRAPAPPPVLTPEEAIEALFATKRLGYVVDPRDKATVLQDGGIPVTADGQLVERLDPTLISAATQITWTNVTVTGQPVWADDAIVPDGVDDVLFFPSGGTAVQPDFGNLAGFVACLLVTPGAPKLQTIWTVGFGGTATNNRLSVQGLANGAAQFVVHDGVARRVFATPAGVLVEGVPVLLTLFVDYQAREAKGFVDGVQRASFTLLNTTDIVNVDSNRCALFRNHGSGEHSSCKLHRAAFLHDRTDAGGRIVMENWVKEFAP